jgi:hypothetical protein
MKWLDYRTSMIDMTHAARWYTHEIRAEKEAYYTSN